MDEMKIWPQPWQNSLWQTLSQLNSQTKESSIRVALMGIGNELRGDDVAGIVVIRGLLAAFPLGVPSNLLLVEAAHAPENHTGPIRKFSPDLVVLIDMAQMNEMPGTVCWLPWQETTGISASTHTMPPYMLARYLTAVTHTEVALIGIQPAHTDLGVPMSDVVETAVNEITASLAIILHAFL
jgi:hydrogenase maturation protease HycI